MRVKFALELEAINETTRTKDIRDFVKRWRNCGIMVYPDLLGSKDQFQKALDRVDQESRKLLEEVWVNVSKDNDPSLRCLPITSQSFNWDEVRTGDDLALRSSIFELAILEDTRALELGIPDAKSKLFDKVEGVRLVDIDVSRIELASFRIAVDDQREDIWKERFQTYAQRSKNVVIVDQWTVEQSNIRGVYWLLRRLKDHSRGCTVTIYTSVRAHNYQRAAQEIKRDIESFFEEEFKLDHGFTIECRLYAAETTDKFAHERHIRFDNHVTYIGRGMYIFENERMRKATDCQQKDLPEGKKDEKEIDLDNNPNRLIIPIFTLS